MIHRVPVPVQPLTYCVTGDKARTRLEGLQRLLALNKMPTLTHV